MIRKHVLVLAAMVCLCGGVRAAFGAVIFYTDRPTWNAAVANTAVTEDFNDAILVPGFSFNKGSISGGKFNDIAAANITTFSFTPNQSAMGGDWDLAGPGGAGTGLKLTLNTAGGPLVLSQEIPRTIAGTFWGFTSDVPFSGVQITNGTQSTGQETYTLDNLSFAVIPEPSTAALGAAAVGLMLARRRAV